MNSLKKILSVIIVSAILLYPLYAISNISDITQIGKGLTNNIISQSIKNALTDDNKNIIDAISQYISDDNKIALIQADTQLTQALNGLTNT